MESGLHSEALEASPATVKLSKYLCALSALPWLKWKIANHSLKTFTSKCLKDRMSNILWLNQHLDRILVYLESSRYIYWLQSSVKVPDRLVARGQGA